MHSFNYELLCQFRLLDFRQFPHPCTLHRLKLSGKEKTQKMPGMRIRFWLETGSRALYLKRRKIFKSLLNEYFRYF